MTYFGFLLLFLGLPLMLLLLLTWRDHWRGNELPVGLRGWPYRPVLATFVIVAVLYTTPWDNYLVATRVWWYDPALVTGIVWGWVPIEEYLFFVVQTMLTGLWTVFLARRIATPALNVAANVTMRWRSVTLVGLIWLTSVIMLVVGWQPGTYLALELVWALLPVLLQLGVGADILWKWRRLLFWSIVPPSLYLCLADAIAITSGTWTIDPAQSTGILLGKLPLEEAIFFTLTNVLVVFGMVLVLAAESQQRIPPRLRTLRKPPQPGMTVHPERTY